MFLVSEPIIEKSFVCPDCGNVWSVCDLQKHYTGASEMFWGQAQAEGPEYKGYEILQWSQPGLLVCDLNVRIIMSSSAFLLLRKLHRLEARHQNRFYLHVAQVRMPNKWLKSEAPLSAGVQ